MHILEYMYMTMIMNIYIKAINVIYKLRMSLRILSSKLSKFSLLTYNQKIYF